ncbi:MAG TPA: methyltransferase domain-containing protein [Gemmatimonadales bacterium]|nr:methyltransferase domain-containing protein [Gemmatimonadales bacterium]
MARTPAGITRWRVAQRYEQGYWAAWADGIVAGALPQLDWYRWRADQLAARLAAARVSDVLAGTARVLEVGSGPVGIAGFLPAAEALLIDPLEEYYASNAVLSAHRSPRGVYRAGVGEALPADSGRYDLAISDNCIDHVRTVAAVMAELRRVLQPGGVLYLTVNCRTRLGFAVHRVLSLLRLDPGHPHTFTPRRVERLLRANHFDPLLVEVASYAEAWRQDLRSRELVGVAKAVLGVSEFLATFVAKRL